MTRPTIARAWSRRARAMHRPERERAVAVSGVQSHMDFGVSMKLFSLLAGACVALGSVGVVQAQQEPPQPGGGEGAYTANLAPPPGQFAISAGGVDIRTGRYVTDATDLSIGEVALTRILSTPLFDHVEP